MKKKPESIEAVKAEKPKETREALQALQVSCDLEESAFNNLLIKTVKEAESTQANIQTLALAAILDCSKRKNAERINALIKALPDSQRKNSLRLWVQTFGAVQWDKGSKQFAFDKAGKLNLWGANQKPWYKAQVETPYQGFNMIEALEAVYNRCAKKLENVKEQDNISIELVNAFGGFIAELKTKETQENIA